MTPTSIHLAKQRTHRRRHEAGAVMFVVSMMITVLAAVGMFALVASATEVRTAGNERQSAQTHFLSQYGVIAVARESEAGRGPALYAMMTTPPSGVTVTCWALPLPSPSYLSGGADSALAKSCGRIDPNTLQMMGTWGINPVETYTGLAPYSASAANPGSLGPVPINPVFFVELTFGGPGRRPPGFSTGNWATVEVSSYGLTVPLLPAGNAFGAEGIEVQRARINVATQYASGP